MDPSPTEQPKKSQTPQQPQGEPATGPGPAEALPVDAGAAMPFNATNGGETTAWADQSATEAEFGFIRRLPAIITCLACTSLLSLAAWFNPSSEGLGTHTQLGLPPCGFKQTSGLPCPTCGCTTSFALAADGRVIDSLVNQPFGGVLAIFTAVLAIVTGYAAVVGLPLTPLGVFLTQNRVIFSFVGLLLAAWVYKIIVTLAAAG